MIQKKTELSGAPSTGVDQSRSQCAMHQQMIGCSENFCKS